MHLDTTDCASTQKTEDERFLYWCDVKGMLVWSEMAAAYRYTDYAVEEFTKEWMEICPTELQPSMHYHLDSDERILGCQPD